MSRRRAGQATPPCRRDRWRRAPPGAGETGSRSAGRCSSGRRRYAASSSARVGGREGRQRILPAQERARHPPASGCADCVSPCVRRHPSWDNRQRHARSRSSCSCASTSTGPSTSGGRSSPRCEAPGPKRAEGIALDGERGVAVGGPSHQPPLWVEARARAAIDDQRIVGRGHLEAQRAGMGGGASRAEHGRSGVGDHRDAALRQGGKSPSPAP